MQSIDCVHSFSSTRTQYEAGEKKVASGILFFDNYITITHLTFQAVLTAVSLYDRIGFYQLDNPDSKKLRGPLYASKE